ncbi:unnamed protein product [Cylindrotheca closterium]|uniref:Uncharacterized protein n=1 Tax=Cylindrotheca closterium TaxID=2856 RepID=A0AAD2CLA1_9STRA|nr:unnamed protein product [Cylindrotheca closterium]
MIYGANNDSCEKDSHSSSYSNLEDDSLMSLLAFPLPSLDQFDSFEDPFDNPSMEPLPLGSQAQVPALVHSSSDSNVMNESSSTKDPTGTTNSHVQDLINILNPLTNSVGSKRTTNDTDYYVPTRSTKVNGRRLQAKGDPVESAVPKARQVQA